MVSFVMWVMSVLRRDAYDISVDISMRCDDMIELAPAVNSGIFMISYGFASAKTSTRIFSMVAVPS